MKGKIAIFVFWGFTNLLNIITFSLLESSSNKTALTIFTSNSDIIRQEIEEKINSIEKVISSFTIFNNYIKYNRTSFDYLGNILLNNTLIRNVVLIEKINEEQKQEYENTFGQITSLENTIPSSFEPIVYFPIKFISNLKVNNNLLNKNLYSEPNRRKIIDRVMSSSTIQLSNPIILSNYQQAEGLLLVIPMTTFELLVGVINYDLFITEMNDFIVKHLGYKSYYISKNEPPSSFLKLIIPIQTYGSDFNLWVYVTEDFYYNYSKPIFITASMLIFLLVTTVTYVILTINKRKKQFRNLKNKFANILSNLYPSFILNDIYGEREIIANKFDNVNVIFIDIAGFTKWCSENEPEYVFFFLHLLYKMYDDLAKHYGVYKVETIGDCFVGLTGIKEINDSDIHSMIKFASELIDSFALINKKINANLQVRVGIHTGPIITGTIGLVNHRWHIFGDTVNTASRMESTGIPSRIQISVDTYNLISSSPYVFEKRENVEIKGKETKETYLVTIAKTPNRLASRRMSSQMINTIQMSSLNSIVIFDGK